METRRLGRTGHASSVAIFGAAALWAADGEIAARAFEGALQAGVNHLDVAPQYGNAQEVLGPLIPAARGRLFIGCKTLRHNAAGVRAQLEDSLRILRCDSFDLYQMHGVTDVDELDRRTGAVGAMMAARDEGLCRYVGITGHNLSAPAAHLQALLRYDLDTVMFPVNRRLWADPEYRRDAEALLAEAEHRDVGVMAIKAVAARPWGPGDPRERHSGTWYEPYTSDEDVAAGVRFTLSVPGVHAFCTPGDVEVLATSLAAANTFTPMTEEDRQTAAAAVAGEPHIFPMPVG